MNTPSTESKAMKFHLGIYAVIEKDQSILLVKKSRGPYRDMWDLPGGRPIHGETILQTLQREVKEETSVEIIDATHYTNEAFIVEYKEGKEAISLHHTCLIYNATQFDASHFQETIHEKDVAGSAWITKSKLKQLPISKTVQCISNTIYFQ